MSDEAPEAMPYIMPDSACPNLLSTPMGKSPSTAKNGAKGVLTRKERLRLELESGCDARTVRKWERGLAVKDASRDRLVRAAKKWNIPIPEKAEAASRAQST